MSYFIYYELYSHLYIYISSVDFFTLSSSNYFTYQLFHYYECWIVEYWCLMPLKCLAKLHQDQQDETINYHPRQKNVQKINQAAFAKLHHQVQV